MTPELECAVKRYRQWFGSYKKSNVSIPHKPFKAAALHSDAAGRTMPRFISVRFVDSHFAQWYCDAVEGITAHPSLIDFPARTELHHLR